MEKASPAVADQLFAAVLLHHQTGEMILKTVHCGSHFLIRELQEG